MVGTSAPYTESVKQYRANRIIELYPQYNERIMREYALGDWYDPFDDHPEAKGTAKET